MKVSLVTTLFNEISNIEKLLDSIVKQTKKPDEFIIVDAGSTDGTIDVIKRYAKKYKWIKLKVIKGISRGKGWNTAIREAKNEIIALTSGGCFLDKNWLKNLIKPFEKGNVDMVIGFYKPYYTNDLGYFEGLLMCPKTIKHVVKIAGRSLAYKKRAWELSGGYYEGVDGADDGKIYVKMFENGVRSTVAKNAVCYWIMPTKLKIYFKKFYNYGYWHRKTFMYRQFIKHTSLVFGSCFYFLLLVASPLISFKLFLSLISLPLLTFILYGIKSFVETKKIKALFYLPMLHFIKDVAFVLGFVFGRREIKE
jgi:glycosyltransferase involved in cell wall biosynthesis